MEHTFTVIVTGPKEILPERVRVQQMVITESDIEDSREDGESDEDVITFIKNDMIDEWAQGFCSCIILDEESGKKLLEHLNHYHGK